MEGESNKLFRWTTISHGKDTDSFPHRDNPFGEYQESRSPFTRDVQYHWICSRPRQVILAS